MNEVTLSIIIPHFNIPDLLEKLIGSIPARNDIQVIIVDDNSTKDIEKLNTVIEKNSFRNLEFYKNYTGKNSAGTCRNIGLEHARGKWIVFADSDDYFMPGWFEKIAPFFDSDNEVVYYSITSAHVETGTPAERHKYTEKIVRDFYNCRSRNNEIKLRYGAPASWMALYNLNYLKRINAQFDNTLTEEDKIFVFTCGDNLKKFDCIPDAIYCLTFREDSLTATKGFEKFDLHQRTQIKRCGALYRKLNKSELEALELEDVGLRMLYTTIMNGYGVKQALIYRRLQKEEGLPLVRGFNPIKLTRRLICSIIDRLKYRKFFGNISVSKKAEDNSDE